MNAPDRRFWASLIALSFGVALVGLMPVLGEPGRLALGDRTVDGMGSWWVQWWVWHALSEGKPLFESEMMFSPWGKDLLQDTGGNVVDALLVVPVRALAGPVLAWNTLALLIFAGNALAVGAWARLRGLGNVPALAAAAVVGLHPYPYYELEMGRPTQALLAPAICALALGLWSMGARERGWLGAAGAGVLLALAGWTYWFAAGFVALALVMAIPGPGPLRRLGRLSVVGLVSLALSAPAVFPLLGALGEGAVGGAFDVGQWWRALGDPNTPISMITATGELGTLSSLLPDGTVQVDSGAGVMVERIAMTWVCLGLAALAVLDRRLWLPVGLVALLVALGPAPLGHKNVFYIGLAQVFSPLQRLYWPCRALSLLLPLAGLGAAALVHRLPRRAGMVMALVLPLAVIGEQGLRSAFPLPSWDPTPPAAWGCLKDQEGAVIVVPYGYDHAPLLFQTLHELPALGGMNERSLHLVPEGQRELREDNPWLAALLSAPSNPRGKGEWTEEDKAALLDLGYRWVAMRPRTLLQGLDPSFAVIHKRVLAIRLRQLMGAPVYVDEELVIYAPWGHPLACAPGEGGGVDVVGTGR